MTKERRTLRHALQKAVFANHFSRNFKAVATNRQMKVAARKIADHILAGKNPQIVHTLP